MKELLERLIIKCYPVDRIDMIFLFEENEYHALVSEPSGRQRTVVCKIQGDEIQLCNRGGDVLFTLNPNEYVILLHCGREYFRKDYQEAKDFALYWRAQVWYMGELIDDYSGLPF